MLARLAKDGTSQLVKKKGYLNVHLGYEWDRLREQRVANEVNDGGALHVTEKATEVKCCGMKRLDAQACATVLHSHIHEQTDISA